jgi:antitoxin MazE
MQYHIQKWGNSLGIRIPKAIAQKAGLVEGTPVEIILDNDNFITIRPMRYSLETLLSGVTPENLHREVDAGKPVGREVW